MLPGFSSVHTHSYIYVHVPTTSVDFHHVWKWTLLFSSWNFICAMFVDVIYDTVCGYELRISIYTWKRIWTRYCEAINTELNDWNRTRRRYSFRKRNYRKNVKFFSRTESFLNVQQQQQQKQKKGTEILAENLNNLTSAKNISWWFFLVYKCALFSHRLIKELVKYGTSGNSLTENGKGLKQ